MVREIVNVCVGQCGIQIGNAFWNTIRSEHKLNQNGVYNPIRSGVNEYQRLSKINVFFNETDEQKTMDETRKFVPRAVIIDLEPGMIDVVRASTLRNFYKPDNFVFGASGANNNWAKGHCTDGAELIDEVVDVIRRETESCECPQGFQLSHSLGGGTGSGLGTLILLKIRDNYPDRINSTYTVFPSQKVSDVVVEPYNATLSIKHLIENSDQTFVIDNEALFNMTHKVTKHYNPTYANLNWPISMVMSGCTASLRFSGELNGDLRKMGVNLVPFPRLHFFLCSHAPLFEPGQGSKVKLNTQELTDQMWSSRNSLSSIHPEEGKYLSAACIYRGNIMDYNMIINSFIRQNALNNKLIPKEIMNLFCKYFPYEQFSREFKIISTHEVEDEMLKIQQKMAEDFVNWIPNNTKTSIIGVAPNDTPMSGTFIANTTAIKGVFQRISAQFAKMFARKSFLHWYKGEGIDEMQIGEAGKNVRDLITEYQEKQDVVVDLEHLYDDEEEEDEEDDEEEDDR